MAALSKVHKKPASSAVLKSRKNLQSKESKYVNATSITVCGRMLVHTDCTVTMRLVVCPVLYGWTV